MYCSKCIVVTNKVVFFIYSLLKREHVFWLFSSDMGLFISLVERCDGGWMPVTTRGRVRGWTWNVRMRHTLTAQFLWKLVLRARLCGVLWLHILAEKLCHGKGKCWLIRLLDRWISNKTYGYPNYNELNVANLWLAVNISRLALARWVPADGSVYSLELEYM